MNRMLLKMYRLLPVLLLGASLEAYAQKTVSGMVSSSQDQMGMPGVSITEKGTTNGTVTDANGRYSLRVGDDAILAFSFIGYQKEEVIVGSQSTIDVVLSPDVTNLSEVVVVAYGTQEEKTISGAVANVEGSEVLKSPSINVSNSLAGRLPGLVAVGQSGEPGADGSTLLIRGLSTLGDNNPLIVVDGVPFRSLERIDPATIESISVIKDASAAIYGSLAANGVILVTTKRGAAGTLQVSANFNQAFSRPTRIPELTNSAEWAKLFNEMVEYGFVTDPKYTADEIQQFEEGSDPWRYPNTNWFDEVLKPWSPQSYANVSVSGGTEKTRIFVALSNRNQDGFFKNSASFYKQHDLRMNIDASPNEHLDLSFGMTGRLEDRNFPTRGSAKIFGELVGALPTYHAHWPDGRIGPPTDITEGSNPVANSTPLGGYNKSQNYVFNINAMATLRIPGIEGLSVTGTAAIDRGFLFSKYFTNPLYLNFWDESTVDANNIPVLTQSQTGGSPKLQQRHDVSGGYMTNLLLNYDRTFAGAHFIKILGGIERLENESSYMSAYRDGFAGTAIDDLWAGTPTSQVNDGASPGKNRWQNYFGRVNYSFKDKYMAEFVWRYQGTSKFARDIRFGFFPGVSVAYRVSEEGFWKENISFVNEFKLRGSWGKTGNDLIPPYQFMSVYDGGYFNFVTTDPTTGALVHNNTINEMVLPADNTTWEEAEQKNIGVDIGLFQSRLSITADYFNNYRTQILIPRTASTPGSGGLSGALPAENIGKVRNKGFDFNIVYQSAAREFNYQVGFNGVHSNNEIVFFDEQPGAPEYQKTTGHPLFTSIYYVASGIYRTQADLDQYPSFNDEAQLGDVIFEDVDQNGVIDALDMKRIDKNHIPTLSLGMTLGAQYKGFDLSILVQGAFGAVRYLRQTSGVNANFLKSFYDKRWSPDAVNSDFPRTFTGGNPYWVASDKFNTFWLRETDYVRLKNIELGYTIPGSITQKINLDNVRIYASALNALTYAPALEDFGVDPEMQPQGDGFTGQGYPLQKVINMGISVKF